MTVPTLTGVELGGDRARPLLVLGPSLGTSPRTLWTLVAERLAEDFHLVGWNLPGHDGAPVAEPFSMAELAAGVLDLVDAVGAERGERVPSFVYAGDSVGGCVGLQLLLDAPDRVAAAAVMCTGAAIGDGDFWADRAATVRASGTPAMVTVAAERWFAPGFVERHPERATPLLHVLQNAEAEGYAQACEALGAFDVRDRLPEIQAPVLAVAGSEDVATPPAFAQLIADGVQRGRVVVLDGVGHLAPIEAPDEVVELIRGLAAPQASPTSPTQAEVYDAGMTVRREVLGDAHVDRATAAITDFTEEFQEMITRYAWGTIWTRPGLDRRSRSLITLTALVARGHHEELAMHVRAAIRNGLTPDEIKELLLQSAIYCGVPDANTAFRIAQQALAEMTPDPR